METRLLHGTTLTSSGGRVRRAVDRDGNEVWSARWNGDALHTLTLYRPDRTTMVLQAEAQAHPLFHRAHALVVAGETVANC